MKNSFFKLINEFKLMFNILFYITGFLQIYQSFKVIAILFYKNEIN